MPAVLAEFFDGSRRRYGAQGFTEGRLRDRPHSPGRECRARTTGSWLTTARSRAGSRALVAGGPAGPDLPRPVRTAARARRYARLLDWAEARSTEIAGGVPARLRARAEQDDEVLIEGAREPRLRVRAALLRDGDRLADEPAAPEWPAGFAPRPFEQADARAVYEADMEAFEDHWDCFPCRFRRVGRVLLRGLGLRSELWFLVEDEGELAGFSICARRSEHDGYVHVLGVRRPWRRRGLGTALSSIRFASSVTRGCETRRSDGRRRKPDGRGTAVRAGRHARRAPLERYRKELP